MNIAAKRPAILVLSDGSVFHGTAIGANGIGNKEAMLEQAASAEPATGPYEASDYKVRFLADDIAVMVHSTPMPEPHWSMHVWQKVDGKWRVAATAAVPVAE